MRVNTRDYLAGRGEPGPTVPGSCSAQEICSKEPRQGKDQGLRCSGNGNDVVSAPFGRRQERGKKGRAHLFYAVTHNLV